MATRHSRGAGRAGGLFLMAAGACLAASTDAAGRLGNWVVQSAWRLITGTQIEAAMMSWAWIAFLQKAVHVSLFGALGMVCGTGGTRTRTTRLLGGLVLCGFTEWLQHWSRTRTASWKDVWLNLFSFAAGFVLAAVWGKDSRAVDTGR